MEEFVGLTQCQSSTVVITAAEDKRQWKEEKPCDSQRFICGEKCCGSQRAMVGLSSEFIN